MLVGEFHIASNYIYIYLKVYILQDNVTGPRDRREYFEDRWITRLNMKAPHGMNTNLKHFAKIHCELFD